VEGSPPEADKQDAMNHGEEYATVEIYHRKSDRLARNSIDGGRVIYTVDTKKLVSMRFPTFWLCKSVYNITGSFVYKGFPLLLSQYILASSSPETA
jgi:hypothetical protein